MVTTNINEALVAYIMSTQLIKINQNETLDIVDQIFKKNNLHHILVVNDEDNLVGIISNEDLLLVKHWATNMGVGSAKAENELLFRSKTAADIMTKKLEVVSPELPLNHCVDIFRSNQFSALPVLDNGELVGIITTYDLLVFAYKSSFR